MLYQIEGGLVRKVTVPGGKLVMLSSGGKVETHDVSNGTIFVHNNGRISEAENEFDVVDQLVKHHLPSRIDGDKDSSKIDISALSLSPSTIAEFIEKKYSRIHVYSNGYGEKRECVLSATPSRHSVTVLAEKVPDPGVFGGKKRFVQFHIERMPFDTPTKIDISNHWWGQNSRTFTQWVAILYGGHANRRKNKFHVSCRNVSRNSITLTKHSLDLSRIKRLAMEGRDDDLLSIIRVMSGSI